MRVVEPHEFKGVKHPKTKRRTGRKFRIVVVLVLVAYVGSTFMQPLPAVTATASTLVPLQPRSISVAWPSTGQAAIGAVGYGVLGTHGEQTALPTASVAKVMTALAVLKQRPLKVGEQGPTITITEDDVNYYQKVVSEDGSNVPVIVGEEITEYQALQALLLPSANNMAHTLARWSYGSESEFTKYVNNFAKSLGMTSAHFDDASGFSADTVSNSEDLARLAVNAMDNPVIAEIVAQKEATIPVAGRIFNVNMLLGHDGIVGLKTGNTEQAGGCFMAAAVKEIAGQKIVAVSVIMGADNLYQALRDSVPLINSVFTGFESATLVKADQTVGTYSLPWGGTVGVKAKNAVSGIVWRGSPVKPDVTINAIGSVPSPIAANTVSGSVRAVFGRTQVETPVVLSGSIQPAPLTWRLKPRFF
jgi:serine-type D-Ala-D-Ala carboxypeptidase (penicillin-binding protein 5/6)